MNNETEEPGELTEESLENAIRALENWRKENCHPLNFQKSWYVYIPGNSDISKVQIEGVKSMKELNKSMTDLKRYSDKLDSYYTGLCGRTYSDEEEAKEDYDRLFTMLNDLRARISLIITEISDTLKSFNKIIPKLNKDIMDES